MTARPALLPPLVALGLLLGCACAQGTEGAAFHASAARSELDAAVVRLRAGLSRPVDATAIPRTIGPDGRVLGTSPRDWTSGFHPGLLWLLYDYSRDMQFERSARQWTAVLEEQKKNVGTHDLGFIIYTSFGNGYRLTGDPRYKDVIVEAARSLATRFNAKVGAIRSWDFGAWRYPVIIDNMMNLELLFAAARLAGDSRYRDIAVAHADTTLRNHFRADGGSYHLVDFDPQTGLVRSKGTVQGAGDGSVWARGQAWAIYGFTMAYRETRNGRYLRGAESAAEFVLQRLPADHVPYWDYGVERTERTPRDASAAAIAAAALCELAELAPAHGARYRLAAERMLASLGASYRATSAGHQFLLLHGTGDFPRRSEVDVPLIYSDYYYVEALLRRLRQAQE